MAEKPAHIIKKIALALFYIFIYFALLYLLTFQVDFMEEDLENYSGVVTIIASIAAAGIYFVMFYLRDINIKNYINARRISLIDGVLAFAMAIGFRLLTGAYLLWSEMNVPILQESIKNAQQGYDFNTMTGFCMVTVILSTCVAAPIFEELLFRGIIQKELADVMPMALAVVLQGLMFGLAHAVLAQSVFAAVYGIILGVVYYKTKNICVVILSHLFFNISSVLEVKNSEMLGQMTVTGLGMTIASILIFFYIYKRKTPAVAGEVT